MIREEHRSAIDWLNSSTADGFNFFAVELQVVPIGASEPAPLFNIVAKPNNWTRIARQSAQRSAEGGLNVSEKARLECWASFAAYVADQKSTFSIRTPGRLAYHNFGFAPGVTIQTWINTDELRVELRLLRDKELFRRLELERDGIEIEFGPKLEWKENEKETLIQSRAAGFNFRDEADRDRQHAWMLDRMKSSDRVFRSRLADTRRREKLPALR